MKSFKKNLPWGILAFFAIVIVLTAVGPYMTFDASNFNNATERFKSVLAIQYIGLFVHAVSGGIALLLGPFQFLIKLRNRHPILHRWTGRIYLTAILFGGISAFIIAPGIISGLVGQFGLLMLAILWLWTGLMAYINIRAGNVEIHHEWMIRNYALTFAAATLRIWLGVLIGTQIPFLETKYAGNFEALFVEVYRVVMWISWVPNLIIAEILIERRHSSPLALKLTTAQARRQSSS
jgi:uncharacterized membrane protein